MEHTTAAPAPAATPDVVTDTPSGPPVRSLDEERAFQEWRREQDMHREQALADAEQPARYIELGDAGSQRLLEEADDGRGWPTHQVLAPASQAAQQDRPPVVEGDSITRRLELPSGGWAELRDPRTIRAKHRKAALDTMGLDRMETRTAGLALDMMEALMIMMVEKWSIPYLPEAGTRPSEMPSALGELQLPDYDALSDRMEEARKLLFPQPATIDNRGPGSPTVPAGG